MTAYHDVKAIKLGAKNNEVPLVVIGYGAYIQRLEEELRQTRPVWMFMLPNHVEFYLWNGDSGFLTVENIARFFFNLIVEHIPDTKIILTGYSFFGLIAFEAASQLNNAGREVEQVILFDTFLENGQRFQLPKRMVYFFRHGKPKMAFEHLFLYLSKKVRKKNSTIQQQPSTIVSDLNQSFGDIERWAEFRHYINYNECGHVLVKIRGMAMRHYNIKPLACKGILFKVHLTEIDILNGSLVDHGWSKHFKGGLQIIFTEGDHGSMVQPPHDLVLAKKMKEVLAIQSY